MHNKLQHYLYIIAWARNNAEAEKGAKTSQGLRGRGFCTLAVDATVEANAREYQLLRPYQYLYLFFYFCKMIKVYKSVVFKILSVC
jgi:hypothetical protein